MLSILSFRSLHFFTCLLLTLFLRFCFSLFLFLNFLAHLLRKLFVAFLAHGFALEVVNFFPQRLVTPTAHKMFLVVMLSQSNDPIVRNGLVTFVADFSELVEVVRLTVGFPLVLIKGGSSKRFFAREA